ncbi:uncharacterized protein B0H64DRAFT_244264 [Chaetomium fimeti]|uniref:Uncharacterized protein n=1 Tax=Chaetomium fimeti TaxID=1854472 RepID=A0AAE0LNJ3_9PEZI|nr:hypothetical protein B0H64DRAFT_244264 [Chaetomium fimeti]
MSRHCGSRLQDSAGRIRTSGTCLELSGGCASLSRVAARLRWRKRRASRMSQPGCVTDLRRDTRDRAFCPGNFGASSFSYNSSYLHSRARPRVSSFVKADQGNSPSMRGNHIFGPCRLRHRRFRRGIRSISLVNPLNIRPSFFTHPHTPRANIRSRISTHARLIPRSSTMDMDGNVAAHPASSPVSPTTRPPPRGQKRREPSDGAGPEGTAQVSPVRPIKKEKKDKKDKEMGKKEKKEQKKKKMLRKQKKREQRIKRQLENERAIARVMVLLHMPESALEAEEEKDESGASDDGWVPVSLFSLHPPFTFRSLLSALSLISHVEPLSFMSLISHLEHFPHSTFYRLARTSSSTSGFIMHFNSQLQH